MLICFELIDTNVIDVHLLWKTRIIYWSAGSSPAATTAIFCANDEMAIGCIHEVKSFGRAVPGDVSIVGFDDTRYAEVTDPPLTTISQPAEEIGERVMYRLSRRIDACNGASSAPEIVPHKLVIRQSVAGPKT